MVVGLLLVPMLFSAVTPVLAGVVGLGLLLDHHEPIILQVLDLPVVELPPLVLFVVAVLEGSVALTIIHLLLVSWLIVLSVPLGVLVSTFGVLVVSVDPVASLAVVILLGSVVGSVLVMSLRRSVGPGVFLLRVLFLCGGNSIGGGLFGHHSLDCSRDLWSFFDLGLFCSSHYWFYWLRSHYFLNLLCLLFNNFLDFFLFFHFILDLLLFDLLFGGSSFFVRFLSLNWNWHRLWLLGLNSNRGIEYILHSQGTLYLLQ